MTLLRAPRRRVDAVSVLGESDRAAMQRLVDADPLVNAVVAARLAGAARLTPAALGGTLIGARADGGRGSLVGAALQAGTLMPVGGDADAWRALARFLARRPRCCTSIVGGAESVHALWRLLAPRWGPARSVRSTQPLLMLGRPGPPADDVRVRAVGRESLEPYLAAAAAMFVEELAVPVQETRRAAFRARVAGLIDAGRAFAVFGRAGQVVFKADIAAVTAHTCQVQGVWVHPDLRGRGLGTAALAGVLRHGLTLAPTVSLYVNDFNAPARRVYEKLGMYQHTTLATVLL